MPLLLSHILSDMAPHRLSRNLLKQPRALQCELYIKHIFIETKRYVRQRPAYGEPKCMLYHMFIWKMMHFRQVGTHVYMYF